MSHKLSPKWCADPLSGPPYCAVDCPADPPHMVGATSDGLRRMIDELGDSLDPRRKDDNAD